MQKEQKEDKISQLRKWMVEKGCIIHKEVEIPSNIQGVQGVSTKGAIPPRTLIIAIPSSLVLTVSKCYKDPILNKLFKGNKSLFDYQESEDAQFNILCVFVMYHYLNINESQWKIYLQTIGMPQTAIDWQDYMLKGLNKSVIQEIIHIRLQCKKLQNQLVLYLLSTSLFSKFSQKQLRQSFNYCYRAVMTRCFGYYFGQASLIPIADLMNHGCQSIDHQLIHLNYEKGIQFYQGYQQKHNKIDCSILGLKKGNLHLPFRQRFLIQNNLISQNLEQLQSLNRQKIDKLIYKYNEQLFKTQTCDIDQLNFCQENDQEDNDTDQEEESQREKQLDRLRHQEIEQMENFKKYFQQVKVQTYKEVEDRYQKLQKQLQQKYKEKTETSLQELSQSQVKIETQSKNEKQQGLISNENENNMDQMKQGHEKKENLHQKQSKNNQLIKGLQSQIKNCEQNKSQTNQTQTTSVPQNNRLHVPIEVLTSDQEQESDDDQWGLQPSAYFTMATSSAVGPNQQLFNSYGSRTNKFLLIWYGFSYRNNLYDSVTLRLQVQFTKQLRKAKDVILDTYVGGQGRAFRKNDGQWVKQTQISKQFRIKRNEICQKLIVFLRLYLLQYYKGKDLYKICVTVPSSWNFQLFVFQYYRQIILALYGRCEIAVIDQLKKDYQEQKDPSNKLKIQFKIIYLEDQRKILDNNLRTVNNLIQILNQCKKQQESSETQQITTLKRKVYEKYSIEQLRWMKDYLLQLKSNYDYVNYSATKNLSMEKV